MITLEEATKIAKELYPEVDNYEEDNTGYVFFNSKDNSFGGKSPVAIVKETGEALTFETYREEMEGKRKVISRDNPLI